MIGRCKICVWPGFQSLSIVIGLCRKKIYNYIIRNLTKAAETLNKYKGPNFARCLQLISKLSCQCAARMVQTMFAIINWNNHFVDILPAKFCCFKGGGFTPEYFENNIPSHVLGVMTRTWANIFGEVFWSMRPLLPMWGIGAKNTQNTNLNEMRWS